jgi:phosphatidylserine decarboxylase
MIVEQGASGVEGQRATGPRDCKSRSLELDRPSAGWRAALAVLRRLPKAGLSRAFGRVADIRLPGVVRVPVLSGFARLVGIDLAEAELPLAEYRSVNDLFVRRLRPGSRTWGDDPDEAGCPVDGRVGQVGVLDEGRLVQAKGRWYEARDLLDDAAEALRFAGGTFATLYLSPRHYHRIHAPAGGTIEAASHVPGALFPVNAAAVAHIPELFVRNERLVCCMDSPLGRVAVVAVGAYNVGRISAAFDPAWTGSERDRWITNRPRPLEPRRRRYGPPLIVSKGQEIMAFHLGSTVIVLFEPGRVTLAPGIATGAEVRLGSPLARTRD